MDGTEISTRSSSFFSVWATPCCYDSADPVRAESADMLSLTDIQELLGLEVLGLIPESKAVLTATNLGQPVIMTEGEATISYIHRQIGSRGRSKNLENNLV